MMNTQPLVSVIIPAFNSGKFIENAINSVLNQSYSNIELILVDDGSSDNTYEVMKKYEDRATLLRHDVNKGGNVARNNGVTASTGALVSFLDSDDLWHSDKLEIYVDALIAHDEISFAFSDFNRFTWSDRRFYALTNSQIHPAIYELIGNYRYEGHKAFVIPRDEMFRLYLGGYPPFSSTILVRRKLFDDVGIWNENLKSNQDFDFSLRCTRVTDFLYIDNPLTDIGRHDTNVSSNIEKQREGDINVMRMHASDDQYSESQKRQIKHYIGIRLAGQGHQLRHTGRYSEAIKKYSESLKYPGMFWHAFIRYMYTVMLSLRHSGKTLFGHDA
ncbi:MAG: glycosyltransferase family 2 protein [Gammaproteobacteria bacterium]